MKKVRAPAIKWMLNWRYQLGGREIMEIKCEVCGKKYRVDHSKVIAETGKFKCRECENILVVTKPEPLEEAELLESHEE